MATNLTHGFSVSSTKNSGSKEKVSGEGYITWTAMGLMVAPLAGVSLKIGSGVGSTSRGKLTREHKVSR